MDKKLKLSILAFVGIVSAAAFSVFFRLFISGGGFWPTVLVIITASFFLSVLLIQTLLVEKSSTMLLMLFLSIIPLVLIAPPKFSILVLLAGAIATVCFFWAYHRGRSEMKDVVEIRFWKIGFTVVNYAASGLVLFSVILYLASFNLRDPLSAKQAIAALLKPVEPFVSLYVPGFRSDFPLDKIAGAIVPRDIALRGESAKRQFIDQYSQELAKIISNAVGLAVGAKDSFLDISYQVTLGRIADFPPLVQNLLLAVAGIVIFLLMKFLLIFTNWIAVLFGGVLYRMLWSFEFFKVELHSVGKHVILLE